jgi:hypothetical protein
VRVLVTGPESSGNRMLCRMVTEAGAHVLHHPMPMSTHWRPGMPGTAATWDGHWSDFAALEWDAALVVVRDPICTLAAQVAAGHVRDSDHAARRYRASLASIFAQLAAATEPWWVVPFESLARPEAAVGICRLLGLDGEPSTCWEDANAKHYGGEPWSDHSRLWERPRAPA